MIAILFFILIVGVPLFLMGVVISNGAPLIASPGPVTRLTRYLDENEARSEEGSDFPELEPLIIFGTPDQTFPRVIDALEQMNLEIVESRSNENRVHALERTQLWKFIDDFHVVIEHREENNSIIRFRSESRVGHADFGANIARIVRFRKKMASAEPSDDG